MRLKLHVIALFTLLTSFVSSFAQYELMLSTCIVNDTLYINVLTAGVNTVSYRSSDFVFDAYDMAGNRAPSVLNYSGMFISREGLWSNDAAAGTVPDYQDMLLGGSDFFNLGVVEDDTTQTGVTLTGGIDTIGVIGVPLSNGYCGDTIQLRWRYAHRADAFNSWPGGPTFGSGDINQWGDPLTSTIQPIGVFIDNNLVILCPGCSDTGGGASTTITPNTDTICLGQSETFHVTPSNGDTVTFFLNGNPVQSTLLDSFVYTPGGLGVDLIHAVVGDPQCTACGSISDTAIVTTVTGFTLGLDVTPFGCDSLTLTATAGWTNYSFYQGGTPHPLNPFGTNTLNIPSPGTGAFTYSVGVQGGVCPDTTFKDTLVNIVSSGITVDLGINSAVVCFGEDTVIHSGYTLGNVNSITWRLDSITNTSSVSGDSVVVSFASPPPPLSRWLYVIVDSAGCVGYDSVLIVNNYVNAAMTPNDSTYCDIDTLMLFAGPHLATANIQWFYNVGAGVTASNVGDSTLVASGLNGPGLHGYVINNTIAGKTCADTTSRIINEIVCNITGTFTTLDSTCVLNPFTVVQSHFSVGDTAWLWDYGVGAVPATSTDSLGAPTVTYTAGGLKNVTYYSYGPSGIDSVTRQIFVYGQMGTTIVSTVLNTPDSIIFGFTPVSGATLYEVAVNINGGGYSAFGPPQSSNGAFTHTDTTVDPLDNVCLRVRFANGCYSDTVEFCTQIFASNCPIAFTPIQPADICLGDSVCFELTDIALPEGRNGVTDSTLYEVNWNTNINNNQESFCFAPGGSGNLTVDFIIFSTETGANCYTEGQMNVNVNDTITGGLNVSPTYVTSNRVDFTWLPVPNATGYIYNAWKSGGVPLGSGDITDTTVSFTSGFIGGDSISIDVYAYSLCDTIKNNDDTVVVIAIDTCFIGYLKTPNSIPNACRYDCYDLSTNITFPASSDWLIEWFGPVTQGPDKDKTVTFCPPAANTQYLVSFEISDTAYTALNGTACSIRDTFIIDVEPVEVPNWDVKTEYCITSFPYQIDVDASPITGYFYTLDPSISSAVYEFGGQWFFDAGLAGLGSHDIVFKVCGDSLVRTFTVGDIPCVTTVFNQSGSRPDGIWTTCDGTVYYSDAGKNSVWSIDTIGNRTLLFGDTTEVFNAFIGGGSGINPDQISGGNSGNAAYFRDGHRSFAKTPRPRGLVVIEGTRDIYFSDSYNHKIRKYDASLQEVITVAGPKTSAVSSDIPVANSSTQIVDSLAQFIQPWGMTMDCSSDFIYFTERGSRKMRSLEIEEGGANAWPYMVRNVAGNAGAGPLLAPASGLNAQFGTGFESHITMDGDIIYIPDPSNNMIFKYDRSTDIIEPYLPFNLPGYADGQINFLSTARVSGPGGTAIIPGADSLFFSGNNFTVRSVLGYKIDTAFVGFVAGQAASAGLDDGPLSIAKFEELTAMRFSSDGYLYVCDWSSNDELGSIRRIALAPELLDPFADVGNLFCLGDPQDTLVSVYPNGTFTVVQGDTSVLTQFGVSDTFFFNPIVADTFLIEFNAPLGCCGIVDTFQIIVQPLPNPMLDSLIFSCDPSSTVIPPNVTDTNWTYVWNDTTSLISGTPLSTNDTLFGVGAGTYFVEVTNTMTNCVGYDTTIVQVGFSDTLQITGTDTLCFGDSVLLSIDTTAFATWWWNTGDSTDQIYANMSGDYIAFAANGACMTSDTFRVIVKPLPPICISSNSDTLFGSWKVRTLSTGYSSLWDVHTSRDGDYLYVTEEGTRNVINRVNLNNNTSSIWAGSVSTGSHNNSTLLNSTFNHPYGVYEDVDGMVYVADRFNHVIRKIDPFNNIVSDFSGIQGVSGTTDSTYNSPFDIKGDGLGNFYVADFSNHRLVKLDNLGDMTIHAGISGINCPTTCDGPRLSARFNWPSTIDIGNNGNLYNVDNGNSKIRETDKSNVTTIGGGATPPIDNPWGITTDLFGNIWVTDQFNNMVRIIKSDGSVENIVGGFNTPRGIDYDPYRNIIYVADNGNNVVKSISLNDSLILCEGQIDTLDASCSGSDSYLWTNITTGQSYGSNPTAIIDTSGLYVLEVTLNGCTNSDTFIVTSLPSPQPNINLLGAGRDTIFGCEGDTLVLSADSLNFSSYTWTSLTGTPFIGAATDSIISTDTSGIYMVEVFNAGGCSTYDTIDVVITQLPVVVLGDSNLCFGETYLVDLSTLGFDSIIWNGTLDTNQLLIDSTGSYAYEAFANGCSTIDTIDVYVADSILIDINAGGDTLFGCLGDSILLEAMPFGYGSYLWSPGGETDSAIYVNVNGEYAVTVSDSTLSRCIASDTVEVQFVPAPVLGLPDVLYVCFGDDGIFSPGTDSLPTGLDSIVWSNGTVMTVDSDTMIISSSGWLYATGYLGSCFDYDSVEVIILNNITLDVNYNVPECRDSAYFGGSPTAIGGSGFGFIYEWVSSTGITLFDDSTSSNPLSTFTRSGVDTVTLTVYDSAEVACFKDTSFIFYHGEIPDSVSLGNDTSLCFGESFCYDFSGSNVTTIIWNFISGGDATQFSAGNGLTGCVDETFLRNGDRNVLASWLVILELGGCSWTNSDQLNILFADSILVDAGIDTAVCPLDTVYLGGNPTASGGTSNWVTNNPFVYNWAASTGATPPADSNVIVTPADSTGYTLIVIDTVTGCTNTDVVSVNVFETPVIDAGTDFTMCAGDTTTLNGSVTPFDASLVVSWSFNLGTLSDTSILDPDAFPIDTTVYYLTVFDTIGCAALSDSVSVNVNANPIASFVADTVCADTVTSLSSPSIGILTWTSTAGTQTGTPITYNFGVGGAYNVTLVANNGGCSDTVIQTVIVDTLPSVYAGEDTSFCITDSITLSDAVGSGFVTWSTLDGGSFSNSSTINPTFTPDTTGTDVLNLFVVDGNGCRNSDTLVLTFAPVPMANAGIYSAGCANTGILLNGASGVGSFNWTTDGDGVFDSSIFITPNYLFGSGDLSNGSVLLTLTATSSPCPVAIDTAALGIYPSAEAVITATVSGGGVVIDSLVEIFVDEGVSFDYLSSFDYVADSTGWDIDGDGLVDDLNDTYFEIYSEDGTSYLYLYASNEYGCYDWDTVRIDVIGNQVVFIPNVFNPTGSTNTDNNFLKVFGTNVLDNSEFDFKIYNRWGELIFESASFSFMNLTGWDGVHQRSGEEQSLGVYTYTVHGQFRDGTTFEKVGNVTLVR